MRAPSMTSSHVRSPRRSAGPCKRCGAARSVRLQKRPGRTVPYKTIPALPIPQDFAVPTCSRCKAEYLDKAAWVTLRPVLAPLYAVELLRRLRLALHTLTAVTSQRRLEQHLGLSQGYLSRLKAGAGNPSPALVLQLQQLALDPLPRLRELERLWGEPIPS